MPRSEPLHPLVAVLLLLHRLAAVLLLLHLLVAVLFPHISALPVRLLGAGFLASSS